MARLGAGQVGKWRKPIATGNSFASAPECDRLMDLIVDTARDLVDGRASVLYLREHPDSRYLKLTAVSNIPVSDLVTDTIQVERSIRKTVDAAAGVYPSVSHVSVPLLLHRKLVGALVVYDPDASDPAGAHELVNHLADHAVAALRSAGGGMAASDAALQDISQCKALKQEISRHKAVLEAMFDHMPVGLVLLNAEDLRVVNVNEAAAEIIGRHAEELVGTTPQDYKGTFDGECAASLCRRAVETGRTAFERLDFVVPGTGRRVIEAVLSPIMDAGCEPRFLLLIITDITQRVSAEEAADSARTEAERRAAEMEAIISNMVEGVAVTDTQGNIVLTNQAARRILPWYDSNQSPRKLWLRANLRHVDGSPIVPEETPVFRALQGEVVTNAKFLIDGASGPDTLLKASVAPVRDSGGQVAGAVTVFRDATEEEWALREIRTIYKRDHKIAQTLQHAFLPRELPSIEGWEIAAAYCPALEEAQVGGDVYDVFHLPGGSIGLVIADVSGKGLRAASQAATVRYMLKGFARETQDPAEVIQKVARCVASEIEEEDFVTIFFGALDPSTGSMDYANAGHEPPLHMSRSEGLVRPLDVTGMAVGMFPSATYVSRQVDLCPGDCLVMYTDGVTDARGVRPRMATDGLEALLKARSGSSPWELIDHILQEVHLRCGNHPPDDLAMVILRAAE